MSFYPAFITFKYPEKIRINLDEVRVTPWNAEKDSQRDEAVKIDIPGQEEEVKEVPPTEEEDTGRDVCSF